MKATDQVDQIRTTRSRISRYALLSGVTLLCLAALTFPESLLVDHIRTHWGDVRAVADAERTETIARALAHAREAVHAAALDAARRADDSARSHPLPSESGVTVVLDDLIAGDIRTVELRAPDGRIEAYAGRPLDAEVRVPDIRRDTVRVHHATPFTDMIAVVPRHAAGGASAGIAVAVLTLQTALPIRNRFFPSAGLLPRIEHELGIDLTIARDPQAGRVRDGRMLAVPIVGSGGDGVLLAARVTPDERIGTLRGWFARGRAALLILTLLFAALGVRTLLRERLTPGWSLLADVTMLWAARITLLAGDVTQTLLPDAVRSPSVFASSFGWGLTSSPAELTLTVAALLTTMLLLDRHAFHDWRHRAWVLALPAAAAVLPPVLRSFAAAMRSVVMDSRYIFDDVAPMFDEPMYVLILLNVVAATLAWMLALRIVARRIRSVRTSSMHTRVVLGAGGALVGLAGFWVLTSDPLIPWGWYPTATAAWTAVLVIPRMVFPKALGAGRGLPLLALVGALLTTGLLMRYADEKRRSDAEAIALTLAQPADVWARALAEQTAMLLAAGPDIGMHGTPDPDTLRHRRAFELWAASPLSSAGTNTAIVLIERDSLVISRFSAGIDPGHLLPARQLAADGEASRLPAGVRSDAPALYAARLTMSDDSTLDVAVYVEGPDRTVREHGTVDLLRSAPEVPSRAPEDRFVIDTYRDGTMVATSDPARTVGWRLPEHVAERLIRGVDRVWSDVDGGPRLFVHTHDSGEILAITPGASDLLYTIYRWIRMIVLFVVTGILIALLSSLPALRPVRLRHASFATRLQVVFLLLTALPVLLLWLAARSHVVRTHAETLEARLAEDLETLSAQVLREGATEAIDDARCAELALRAGRPVTIYRGADVQASSRPELYDTGLLDPRMPAAAYRAVVAGGAGRAFVRETVGTFSYLVGYRGIGPADSTRTVVAAPALLESQRAEAEYIRASASLFLGIALILLLAIPISAVLARQVSRPLALLTEATRDIAAGRLDLRVTATGSREIDALTAAFNSMTGELRQSRERLAAAERDHAWKEMARQVAHEIRNPLTPMKLAAQHLQRAAEDDAPELRPLIFRITGTIIAQIDALARISGEFSRFARMPRRERRPVDPVPILRDTAALFAADPRLVIELDVPDSLPALLGDPEDCSRMLTNILRNAAQAIDDHGTIRISAAVDGSTIQIVISDTGPGVDEELLPRIFEPNFSTKTEGMGLGLAIVRTIVEEMGGSVHARAAAPHGLVVELRIPVLTDAVRVSESG